MRKKINIFMEDAVLVNDKVFFFSRYWNALYAANLITEKIELISVMPEEEIETKRLCAGIIYHNEKLILVPMVAKKIWIYNLKEDSWQGLERKYMVNRDLHMLMFRAIKYKNDLFFIGSNYPAIVRMDLDNYKLEYWKEPYDFLISVKNKDECYFRADHLLVGNQLFLASCLNHFVLCLNLDTFSYTWHEVGEQDFQYSGIAWDGENYWLSPRMGTPIVRWDGKDQVEYFSLPNEFEHDKYNFLGVQYDDGKLVFPGMFQNKTLLIDPRHPYNTEIRKERYTFYRCFGVGGRLTQTIDGCLRWRYSEQNVSGQMYCGVLFADFVEHFRKKFGEIKYWRLRDEISTEYPSALVLYLSMIEQGMEKEKEKEKGKIGRLIWRIIYS